MIERLLLQKKLSMSEKVRVRFAPSPTGPLHMGGVRTALFNYLFAKKHKGTFVLRIEDTDQTRYVPGAEEYIKESLEWCGLLPDESPWNPGAYGPYRQSERKDIYKPFAEKLVQEGHAYYAFDTPEELEIMRENLKKAGVAAPQYNHITRMSMKNSITLPQEETRRRIESGEPYVIRVKIPRNEEIKFYDQIRGWVVVNSNNIDDKVLFKSDGMPTYHLANVVDDLLMEITHVIRGEEWLPSAPLHVLLYKMLGKEDAMPQFAHLPLILRPDGNGKLSKRDGDRLGFPVFPLTWKDPQTGEVSIGYSERGYFPEAFVNMLALLGWNPGNNRELFSMQELIELFSLERVNKSGAKFDPDKARWFNQQYLRMKNPEELAVLWQKDLTGRGINADTGYIARVVKLLMEKAHFVGEFWELGKFFFVDPESYDEKVIEKKLNEKSSAFLQAFKNAIENKAFRTHEDAHELFQQVAQDMQIKPGEVMQLLRVAITGQGSGPALFEILELLGPEKTIERLERFLKKHAQPD